VPKAPGGGGCGVADEGVDAHGVFCERRAWPIAPPWETVVPVMRKVGCDMVVEIG
jgi:hypothetical protein